jgi:hypothetical protein
MDTLGCINGYTIRLVDGAALRQQDTDFSGYGHHDTNTGIPEKEIWLDTSADPKELSFFLLRALYERLLYDRGISKERIQESSKGLDQVLRTAQVPAPLKERFFTHFNEMDVWFVNGEQVRKQFDPDYILGGNGYRYDYIPKNEIWIENVLSPADKIYTLLHEVFETSRMKEGIPYDSAHEQATYVEKKLRNTVKP